MKTTEEEFVDLWRVVLHLQETVVHLQGTVITLQGTVIALQQRAVAKQRLEYLRQELQAERISYGELAELQALVSYIDPTDTELLEAAGVPEFKED